MGLFKVNTSKEAVADKSGSSYIAKSGIYDVTIKFASLETSKNGAESVNFNIEWEGNSQTIYGPYVQAKNGDVIEGGLKLINKLAIIAGLGNGEEPTIEQETHKVGKDNKEKEFAVITDFSDLDLKMRLQEVYSSYNGEIRKKMAIRGFYDANGASASELTNDEQVAGTQIEKDKAYAEKVTYEDGVTPEDVAAWKEAKANGEDTPKVASTPKATAGKPKSGLFK